MREIALRMGFHSSVVQGFGDAFGCSMLVGGSGW